ncbi:MAG: 50S ribosomal protein L4 [bacterium]|nr:50S ribosomal protein L4 [bacterium]
MITDVYNQKGKTTIKVTLPEKYFGVEINEPLLEQAVHVYLSNQRSARAQTKTRSDVDRTKAKWFRQKGTGHARHGARSAHIFVGGGVAHGPTGTQNYKRKLSKKMKQEALACSLTLKFKNKEVIIIEGLEKVGGKTKEAAQFLKAFNCEKGKNILLVLERRNETLNRAFSNLRHVFVRPISSLNTYEILNTSKILITKSAIERLKEKKS